RCAGGHAYGSLASDPFGAKLVGTIDHVRRNTAIRRDLAQPVGVGAVRAADNDHDIGGSGHEFHGILAILRGVADVVLLGTDDPREATLEGGNDSGGIV